MNKPTPTKGPWEHHFLSGRDRIVGPNGECIAETGRWKESELPEMHANAAFIVRACNSHAAMLEALKGIIDAADDPDNEKDSDLVDMIDWKGIRKAIRLAEGRS